MSYRLKRLIVSFGVVIVVAFGLTALDKHNERSCRQNPALIAWAQFDPEVWLVSIASASPTTQPSEAPDLAALQSLSIPDICDGVLPW
jgi:hypothetical protein